MTANIKKLAEITVAILVCTGIQTTLAWSASYDQTEYQGLLDQASRKGYVRTMANLDIDVPMAANLRTPSIKSSLTAKEDALLAKLGNNALKTGVWRNGLGQMGIYVNTTGLQQLAKSSDARTIGRDSTDGLRTSVYDGDGRLARIEEAIEKNGFADVEVDLNLENFYFDIASNGKTIHKPSSAQQAEVRSMLPSFHASLPENGVPNLVQLKADAGKPESRVPTHALRINKEGLFALKEHDQVRAIQLANIITEPPRLDTEVLDAARKNGYADVIINLRFAGYSPLSGKLPAKAWQAQAASIRRAFVEVLSDLEPEAVKLAQDFGGLAGASVRLTANALERLFRTPDPRIQSIILNKIAAVPLLAQSNPWINIPQAWDKGYTANGQSIAVFDTGFEKTHPFLQDALGQPKIIYEACFGTQSLPTYSTLCPSPDANGDSPLGMPGSAANCTSYNQCDHGTYVAGIAAGKRGWNGLSGVAPDAKIIGVKVFSLKTTDNSLNALSVDITAGMQAMVQYSGSEATVNLSLGGGLYSSTCAGVDPLFDQAVTNLISKRIPVVAAVGNDGQSYYGKIAWPSCAPKVIKVANSFDYQDSLHFTSNGISPSAVDGPVFAAPGTFITSATLGGGTMTAGSTSGAAPHVSGLYAAIKAGNPGISVADATAWINANGVPFSVPATPSAYTLKRIRVPNL